jgi:osmotically-inducible protein OsmY
MNLNSLKLCVLACILLLNAGCAAFFLAGAAGGYIVYDDRSVHSLEKDARIFHMAHTQYVKNPQLRDAHLTLSSFKQIVLLTGQCQTASQRALAEKIARSAPNVRKIYNQLTIQAPTSAWRRTRDTAITTNIRAHMLAKKDLESGAIKIITENGVVYLMGELTNHQANLAVNVARDIPGVFKVVKVFHYIDA